ncbi:MAG TPA: protein translocase subunit SecF [Candidatus Babeliales bacterium]|nr:protein translocase subunit SecF [Candidatus Babeliales bacterium]
MFDFLKYRYVCLAFFLVLVAAFIGGYWQRGGFNYSVDFTGGTAVLVQFAQAVNAEQIHQILEAHGQYKGVEIRELAGNQALVRVQEFEGDSQGIGGRITADLQQGLTGNKLELLQGNSVGSSVGDSLRWDSIKATLLVLLAVLLYIALRFKLLFALGAVIALLHDLLFILVYFLLTNSEISMEVIGAILMVLAYSMNDTIVVFSRIRENLKKMAGSSIATIINTSLNQTLRRTTLTSSATALVVLSLIFFGGEMLRGLSVALLLGIVIGTYSSIFVASPIMLLFYKLKQN